MNNYMQYQQLLSNSIQEQELESQGIKEQFEKKLAVTEGEKGMIEKTTDSIGGLLLIKPSEAISKVGGRLIKKATNAIGDKVSDLTDAIGEKVSDLTDIAKEKAEQVVKTVTEKFQRATGTQEPRNAQNEIMEQDPEDNIVDAPDAPAAAPDAAPAVGDAAPALIEDVAPPLLENAAPAAADSLLLDIDPLTAIFGLIFGIASVVGGIEGANSIKTPSVPKVPLIAQSSVQFGL